MLEYKVADVQFKGTLKRLPLLHCRVPQWKDIGNGFVNLPLCLCPAAGHRRRPSAGPRIAASGQRLHSRITGRSRQGRSSGTAREHRAVHRYSGFPEPSRRCRSATDRTHPSPGSARRQGLRSGCGRRRLSPVQRNMSGTKRTARCCRRSRDQSGRISSPARGFSVDRGGDKDE